MIDTRIRHRAEVRLPDCHPPSLIFDPQVLDSNVGKHLTGQATWVFAQVPVTCFVNDKIAHERSEGAATCSKTVTKSNLSGPGEHPRFILVSKDPVDHFVGRRMVNQFVRQHIQLDQGCVVVTRLAYAQIIAVCKSSDVIEVAQSHPILEDLRLLLGWL